MLLFGFGLGFGQPSSRYSKNYWCQSVCLVLVILIHTVSRECSGGEVPSVNVMKEPQLQVSSRAASSVVPGRSTAGRSGGQEVQSSEVKAPPTDGNSNSKPSRAGGSRAERGRAMSSVFSLDPMGMIKSASRVLTKGVHTFRESLHEGVKVAQMLKDDVDEGVTQIWGQKKSSSSNTANNKEKEKETEIETNTEDKMHRPTGDAASEPHSFPQDTGKFSNSNNKQTFREGMLGGIGGILRFMNVDSSRLGIIALNLLIYVAEMITTSLLGKDNSISETRAIKANILQYFITGHSNMLDNLMKDAKSEALPESLIETLRTKTGNDTSCVQLLICKMSPLIWSVQKTLEKNPEKTTKSSSSSQQNGNGDSKKGKTSRERPRSSTGSDSGSSSVIDDLYSALPSKGGFISNGDKCEKRFPNCRLLKFTKH